MTEFDTGVRRDGSTLDPCPTGYITSMISQTSKSVEVALTTCSQEADISKVRGGNK